jgi:hypothetical protein
MSILNPSRTKGSSEWEDTLECDQENTGNTLSLYDRFGGRPRLLGSEGIMHRFGMKQPRKKGFGRQDIFKKGDTVMFRSELFEKVVTGVICEDSNLVRRWNGKAYYKVAIHKRSRSNPMKQSSKPPILETVEASLMELKHKWELRVSRNTFNKLFLYGKALALTKWIYTIHCEWHEEERQRCATMIQRKWKNYKSNLMAALHAAMRAEAARKRREAEAARLKAIEDEKKRIAFEAYVREVGVTPDGEHYFLTRREMRVFLQTREKALKNAKRIFSRIWRGDMHRVLHLAWDRWIELRDFLRGHKAFDPVEEWTLSHIPEYRARILKDHVPHPAHGIKMRPMASTGTKARKDGSFRITSIEQFRKFQTSMTGPIDQSCWLIKGKLLVGGIPVGMAKANREGVGGKGTCAAALMNYKVGAYFCLCTKEELAELPEGGFTRDIDRKAKDQVRVFRNTLRMREGRIPQIDSDLKEILYKQKMSSADRKADFIPEIENNQKMREKAMESIAKAKEMIKAWPEFPEYYYYPIEGQEGLLPPQQVKKMCEHIEAKLRGGNVYVFSKTGHGRAGVLGACLLGRLYGYTQDEALVRMQRLHATRADMQSRIGHSQRARMAPIQCPKSKNQRMLVREVLAMNDEVYRATARCMSPRGTQASLAYKNAVEKSMAPSMSAIGWPDPIPVKSPVFNFPRKDFVGFIYGSLRKWRRGMGVPIQESEAKPVWWEVRDKELSDARKQRFLEIEKAHAAAVLGHRSGAAGLPAIGMPPPDRAAARAEAKRRAKARARKKKSKQKGKGKEKKKKKKKKKEKEEEDDEYMDTDEENEPVAGGYLL